MAIPRKLNLFLFFLPFLGSCVMPYAGETVVIPIVNEEKTSAIQIGPSSSTFQKSFTEHHFGGFQTNYVVKPILGTTTSSDSGYKARNQFYDLRAFVGYQGLPSAGNHSLYALGGVSAGYISFNEESTGFSDSGIPISKLNLKYQTTFQTAFVEVGAKLYRGVFGIPLGQNFSVFIPAPTWWMPHAGIKLVYFNNIHFSRQQTGDPEPLKSKVFGYSKEIFYRPALVFQFGLTWLYSGKTMNYFYDVTYHNGDPMFNPITFRLGLGVRF